MPWRKGQRAIASADSRRASSGLSRTRRMRGTISVRSAVRSSIAPRSSASFRCAGRRRAILVDPAQEPQRGQQRPGHERADRPMHVRACALQLRDGALGELGGFAEALLVERNAGACPRPTQSLGAGGAARELARPLEGLRGALLCVRAPSIAM